MDSERKKTSPKKLGREEIEQELLSAEMLWQQAQDYTQAFEDVLQKWKSIILHANPNTVHRELDRILELLVLQEEVILACGAADRIQEIQEQIFKDSALRQRLEDAKKNFAIESMGYILSSE